VTLSAVFEDIFNCWERFTSHCVAHGRIGSYIYNNDFYGRDP